MNFPSVEFGDAVARLCFGTATENQIEELHALLKSDQAAQDDYLWQVELHARLAQSVSAPDSMVRVLSPSLGDRQLPLARPNRRFEWSAVAALLVIACGIFWMVRAPATQKKGAEGDAPATTATMAQTGSSEGAGFSGASHAAGVYRTTVRFAIADNAPVIVGTGRAEPIALGAEVPLEPGGDTLHVWDWSKSPVSRVMKDVRLWPQDVFAVSPDGKTLVCANGKVLDLATGESSTIDLGGQFHLDHLGGNLERIVSLQFTADGRHLAVKLSNVVLTKSTHPLRKQDFSTETTIQVVTFPEARLVCEFPAGLRMAISRDATRAAIAVPENKSNQQIVEYSAVTGEVLRKYEPRLREFAQALALSPDATRLAAFDAAGELLIWDSTTGELKHRLPIKEGSAADLRFSPDGKLLAVSLIKKTWVIDPASGAIVGAVPQESPGLVRWTPDNRAFDIITSITSGIISEHDDAAGHANVFNIFPALKRWTIEDLK